MMSLFIKLLPFLAGRFGLPDNQSQPDYFPQSPKNIYMKRVSFALVVLLAMWALFFPDSLALQLDRAADVLPGWFVSALATVFAGVWIP